MKTLLAALAVAVASVVYPHWIELTGLDPDGGSGLVEVVAPWVVLVIAAARVAVAELRRVG